MALKESKKLCDMYYLNSSKHKRSEMLHYSLGHHTNQTRAPTEGALTTVPSKLHPSISRSPCKRKPPSAEGARSASDVTAHKGRISHYITFLLKATEPLGDSVHIQRRAATSNKRAMFNRWPLKVQACRRRTLSNCHASGEYDVGRAADVAQDTNGSHLMFSAYTCLPKPSPQTNPRLNDNCCFNKG